MLLKSLSHYFLTCLSPHFLNLEWYPCRRHSWKEEVSQTSWHYCPLSVQCRVTSLAGLLKTTHASAMCLWYLSLMPNENWKQEQVQTGAAWYTSKPTVFKTLTHSSACLGQISSLFIAGVYLKFCLLHPRLSCSSPIRHTSRDKLWYSNIHNPLWMTACLFMS